jgi:hypothetical protein
MEEKPMPILSPLENQFREILGLAATHSAPYYITVLQFP